MTPWFLARAAGLTAYAAFSASTIAGLLLSSKFLGKKASKALTLVHEALSIAGVLLIFVHGWAILNDSVFSFTWRSLLLPGFSPYAPVAVGIGVVAAWLSVIVVLSFYVRKKIGPRTWRRLHYITPLVFVAMTAHGLMAGTDARTPAALALYAGSVGTMLVLLGYRVTVASIDRKAAAARRASHSRALPRVAAPS